MKNNVYFKLSLDNIKKNKQIYLPYILSTILSIFMLYILHSLGNNPGLAKMSGGGEMKGILLFGVIVMMLFVVVFLFYTNSFIIKRRKKEFGLYGILGMEKKHVSIVVLYETLIILAVSLIIGLSVSIILDKLLFLSVVKMLKANVPFGFYISYSSIIFTSIFIIALFFVIFLNSLRHVHTAKPIELLNSGKTGEKEPKAKFLLSLIGLIFLGAGYYISITTKNPLAAIMLFFVAVILVILGTYILFTTGSITVLKLLKKNKSYYYKPKNFISISSMIYRMKQNAIGLANIAILSTMVLVILSTTVALWFGVDGLVKTRYPKEIMISSIHKKEDNFNDVNSMVNKTIKENGVQIRDVESYLSIDFQGVINDGKLIVPSEINIMDKNVTSMEVINIVNLEEYNKLFDINLNLKEDEIFLYSNRVPKDIKSLQIAGKNYQIKRNDSKYLHDDLFASNVFNINNIIVKDKSTMVEIRDSINKIDSENYIKIKRYYGFDTNVTKKENIKLYEELKKTIKEENAILKSKGSNEYSLIESRSFSTDSFKSVYAGLFFIGVFLSALFLLATIIIMYYKQISEGLEDKDRYKIMQNVGLDKSMIKKSINSQVLIVFFLPLLVACIHLAFALPIIRRMMALLMLTDFLILLKYTFASICLFSIVYYLIYRFTSKTYYNIVRKSNLS